MTDTKHRQRLWREASTRANRKRGVRSFKKNKDCAQYFGIHIAERVLSHVFKDVKRMPITNHGYDVICNKDKLIDIKSACLSRTQCPRWQFNIRCNTTADYFLCLAFDNREDLNPLHAWLILGSVINHLKGLSICPSTLHKWDAYALDISKVSECCNTLRTAEAVSA